MVKRCAWCGRDLGKVGPLNDESVTHGICSECERVANEDLDKPMPFEYEGGGRWNVNP